jgi:Holliday junction DNA helicase RuvB
LDFYETEDLVKIISRSAGILEVPLEADAAQEIAKRSRGTPRVANRLLRRVRDYAQIKTGGKITQEAAIGSLKIEGIDSMGLDELDRKYLGVIIQHHSGGPVGVEAVAATLNEEAETLEEMVEPYLLKIGFISRTRNGRKANTAAYQHLGIKDPRPQGELSI